MSDLINKAENFIIENRNKTQNLFRPKFHFSSNVGWINDPNGFCHYENEYHLFYQYHPYSEKWGPMHWGHATSKDLLIWKEKKIALAPDKEYDKDGCFSGSAIVAEDRLNLIYTGHIKNSENIDDYYQIQNLATTNNGIDFEKYIGNPILNSEEIPVDCSKKDFRDPKIFKKNNKFYLLIGSRNENETEGQALFFVSSDLKKWSYLNRLKLKNMGNMWECPDFFELDGKAVIIFSPMNKKEEKNKFQNENVAVYVIGDFNYENGVFKVEKYDELDSGFDYYAPQTTVNKSQDRIMIAWVNTWNTPQPLDEMKHGWNGFMSLPRKLNIENNVLKMQPVESVNKLFNKKIENFFNFIYDKKALRIKLSLKYEFRIILCKKEDSFFELSRSENLITLKKVNLIKTKFSERTIEVETDNTVLDIFIDNCILEIFVNDGKYCFTSRVFNNFNIPLDIRPDKNVILNIEVYENS